MSTFEYASASAVKKLNMLCEGLRKLNCGRDRAQRASDAHACESTRSSTVRGERARLRVHMLAARQARQEALAVARDELRRELDDVQVEGGDAVRQRNRVLLLESITR
jgi:hypothetical protein